MLIQEVYSAFAFAFLVGLACLGNYLTNYIGVQVLTEQNERAHPNSFIATRSYKDLKVLNDFGPKATGSVANEVHAVNFLLQRANQIKNDYGNSSEITIDHQLVSGVHLVAAYYQNVQNIVVKLHGESDTAVMINCHFDSEPGSYGAGDDGVNCCTMLEILRVMAKSGRRNMYSTIFLFNGNEEGNLEGLQASHGFISQHKWAKDIKAYVNLEAQGIGGRELLFRSGPKHNWLITKYRQSVKNPSGQVFAEEMFETNILKSRTDFESFRDVGHIPGLDIAYCRGGWKYHTKFDHIRYVTLDSIQNTGNNILELVKLLANSKEMDEPPEGTAAVYFDVFGIFFVSYSALVGKVLNIVISVLAVLIPFLVHIKDDFRHFAGVLRETLISFFTFAVSVILSLGACFAMGLIMNMTDNSMFWFNSTILSIGVYCSLAVLVQIAVHHLSSFVVQKIESKTLPSEKKRKYIERRKIHAQLNGINLFWAVLTVTVSSFGFRFGYIMMVLLLISLVTNLITYLLYLTLPKTRIHSWIFLHFIGHTFSFLWTSYLLLTLWKVFIPITEKTYNANPETTISLFCGLMTVLTLSYFIPLTSLVRNRAILYSTLISALTVSIILSFTSAGFPYSGSIVEPRVQRHYPIHTIRKFYDANGRISFTDNGFFVKENERNSKRTLDMIFDSGRMIAKNEDVMCKTEAFCGFPSYNTTNAFWMAANEPPNVTPTVLKLNSRVESGDSVKLNFDVFGTLLTFLYVAPEPGAEIIDSSIAFNKREWVDGRVAHYLKLTYGKPSPEPFTFSLTIKTSNPDDESSIKITVVTTDSHFGESPVAGEFQTFIDKFPDYTFVQSHQADVSSYPFK